MTLEFSNVFYYANINKIGGVESFFWYLIQNLKDFDITILYSSGDPNQISRLKQYARVIKFTPNLKIHCKKLFLNYNIDLIDKIDADEYIQILHAAYKTVGVTPATHPKITKYIGVSKVVCDEFTELTGLPASVVYNPLNIKTPQRMLNLISATRLTREKGKHRIEKMSQMLNDSNIPYTWTIFTDDIDAIKNDNIVWRKPKLDIANYIAEADYLVQLSDAEGYGYSIVESLCLGTPVIVTDMPVVHELGVVHHKNGFIINHNLSNFNPHEIYETQLSFTYKPKKSSWEALIDLQPKINTISKKYLVRATNLYKRHNIIDSSLGRIPMPGEEFEVSEERLFTLLGNNTLGRQFVTLLSEV